MMKSSPSRNAKPAGQLAVLLVAWMFALPIFATSLKQAAGERFRIGCTIAEGPAAFAATGLKWMVPELDVGPLLWTVSGAGPELDTKGAADRSTSPNTSGLPDTKSLLEIVDVNSGKRQVVFRTPKHIEAPNWSRDGSYLLFNGDGAIFKLPVTGGRPQQIAITPGIKCNNDHGISPDGTQLVVSGEVVPGSGSRIYRLPIDGGDAKQITPLAPSYWHGWSPDGKTLTYCAERQGEFDIYTVPVGGGQETRLTTAPGLDDGPEYSPDGDFIYFNSERTGLMQIWRMQPDGSQQEQITSDDYNNWFAHPSPDGKWIVLLSYAKSVKGHPPGQNVELRLMSLSDRSIRVLARLFGGQGTINVPSWAPDSSRIAFVSYRPMEK